MSILDHYNKSFVSTFWIVYSDFGFTFVGNAFFDRGKSALTEFSGFGRCLPNFNNLKMALVKFKGNGSVVAAFG